jgi:prepilin-type N-terminal cleavage/methylation domain-containing protein
MASLKDKQGLTLVEVLATSVMMAVFIALAMTAVAGSLRISGNAEETSRCILLADRKMDEIKSKVLGVSIDPGYSFGWNQDYSQTGAFPSPDLDYRYSITDPDYPASGNYIRDISLTVWYDKDGDGTQDSSEKSVTRDTKIARRD